MKKLTFSLILIVIFSIIGLGWVLDNLFSQYQSHNKYDELKPYKELGTILAKTLNQQTNIEEFINDWQTQNVVEVTLLNLNAFPLPESLQKKFYQGEPLTLESENSIFIHFILPKKDKILIVTLPAQTKKHDNNLLKLAFTAIFYIAILLILFIWLYPLIKHLRQLRKTAKAFGEGKLEKRIPINSTSYITDIEVEFNKMAQRIETLVSDNKLLGNAVSHDLRTPLARLRFGIEALEETTNPQLRDKYQKHISKDIDEMEKLVAVLLNYARLEQAMVTIEKRDINLNNLISDCINTKISSDITIQWLKSEPAIIIGDINYLTMLFNNLLSNAQQYSNKTISVDIKQTKTEISVIVADDGPGIIKEKRHEILKPFTRGDNTLNKHGYGIGLAIVARIALWHDAILKIDDSKQLGGAEFSITFKKH
ncbi:ATP-binding protein [Pseudoalteromonas denitrificans]|uniref:histidine kinase n=1 Tax=Pseudoalteromonas denitrificans DSM 6059 TaxID=1123010 RepID=A0A1I1NJS2_9GAMM|nr:ATP-binding protein [Pseudoalteromonas denitrificans]SFC97899.1 two-component system, OmpR family, sensor kinase [Pseudoalteromonas denitrificans DSM 6059]